MEGGGGKARSAWQREQGRRFAQGEARRKQHGRDAGVCVERVACAAPLGREVLLLGGGG